MPNAPVDKWVYIRLHGMGLCGSTCLIATWFGDVRLEAGLQVGLLVCSLFLYALNECRTEKPTLKL
jgi:hypothetical protein